MFKVGTGNGEWRVNLSGLLIRRVIIDNGLLDRADGVSWVIREQTLRADYWATHWNMLESRVWDIQLKSNWPVGTKANKGVVERVLVSDSHWWESQCLLIIARVNRHLRRVGVKERDRVVVVTWAHLSRRHLASTVRVRTHVCHFDRVSCWVVGCTAR